MRGDRGTGIEAGRQQVLPVVHQRGNLGERRVAKLHRLAHCRNALRKRARGAEHGLAGDGEAARGEGAAAHRRHERIAASDAHRLERHVELFGDKLRKRRLDALALVLVGGDARDAARRLEAQRAAFLRRDLHARRAVEAGAGRVLLDERGEADAEVPAPFAFFSLFFSKSTVVHEREQAIEAGLVRQPARLHPARGRALAAEVAAAKLGRIDVRLARADVDQRLDSAARERLADAAVRAGGGLVLPRDAQAAAIGADVVRRPREQQHLQSFQDARARIRRVRAGLGEIVERERGNARSRIQRHRYRDPVRARVDVRHEGFQAVADVLHRAPGEDRGGADRHLVVIHVQLHAEATTDVRGEHANVLLGKAEAIGVDRAHLVRHLRGLMDGELTHARIELGDEGARLERHAGVAGETQRALHRAPAGRRRAALDGVLEGEVTAELGVQERRRGLECRFRVGKRVERLPFHFDALDRVLRDGAAFGEHDRHRLSLP